MKYREPVEVFHPTPDDCGGPGNKTHFPRYLTGATEFANIANRVGQAAAGPAANAFRD